jgi:hypothetical protein
MKRTTSSKSKERKRHSQETARKERESQSTGKKVEKRERERERLQTSDLLPFCQKEQCSLLQKEEIFEQEKEVAFS